MSAEIAESAIKNLQKVNYWSRGEIDLAGLGFWVDAMKEQGESVPTQDLKAMTTDSFLPQDLRQKS